MIDLASMSEREYFANVGKRPAMFVGRTSYQLLVAFLTGYDQHAMRHGNGGWPADWSDWLSGRVGGHDALGRPSYVLRLTVPDGPAHYASLAPECRAGRA